MAVAKVGTRVELDDAVLRTVDTMAELLGRSRQDVLEDSVRRGLAARRLGEVLARVRARNELDENQAARVAYDEVKAARSDRRARPDSSESIDELPM
jgi:predicted transcriptional regulator